MKLEKETFTKMLADLERQRDELRLQVHLATAEVRDQWQQLEDKWHDIKPKLEAVRQDTAQTTKNLWSALALAAEELKSGYQRVRNDMR